MEAEQLTCQECRASYTFDEGYNDMFCSQFCAEAAYINGLADRAYDQRVDDFLTNSL